MRKRILAALLLLAIAFGTVNVTFAADETLPEVEFYRERLANAFNYELRPEKGDVIPYGKGRYTDCYYPQGCGQERPEFYTWGNGLIELNGKFVSFMPSKADKFSVTFDTSPKSYYMDYNKPFFTFVVKTDKAFDGFIEFGTLDGKYKKSWNVKYTGEWQKVILDFSSPHGWNVKNDEGEFVPVIGTPFSNDINKLYGGHSMRLPGTGKCNEYIFDYIAMFSTLEEAQAFNGIAAVKSTSVAKNDEKRTILASKGTDPTFMKGYSDGTFKPNKGMTRAEACTVIARLMGTEDEFSTETPVRFGDVKSDAWYYKYISFLDENGVLADFSGDFKPDESITRAEFVAMLFAAGGFKEAIKNEGFTDVGKDLKFGKAIYAASEAGVVKGYADGSFKPDKVLTRAEIAVMLTRLLEVKPNADEEQMFTDLDKSFWGYGEIMSIIIPDALVVDFEKTKAVIADIDAKAKTLKENILSTETKVEITGTSYYVSAEGNDENDGKSPETAWKTMEKVSGATLKKGDGVFFRRGDIFRGKTMLLKNGVTYSAYGEGEKPIITASPENGADSSKWELVDEANKVWRYAAKLNDQGTLVFDGGKAYAVKLIPDFKDGKFVTSSGNEFTTADMKNDLDLFCETKDGVTSYPSPGSTLGYIYLRCEKGNPGEVFESIEFMPTYHIMKAGTPDYILRNVTIDNLSIRYSGAHGIHCSAAVNYTVQNCEFKYIGGGVQSYTLNKTNPGRPVRYGNAVELGTCDGFTVKNCYLDNMYDAGLTFQTGSGSVDECVKNVTFEGNLIENCTYSVECFMGEPKTEGADKYIENFSIKNNIMRFAGYGFGKTRNDKSPDAHIKTWNAYNKVKDKSFVVEGNIIDRSTYMMFHIGIKNESELDSLPIMKNNLIVQTLSANDNTATLGIFGLGTGRRPYDENIPSYMKALRVPSGNDNEFYFCK